MAALVVRERAGGWEDGSNLQQDCVEGAACIIFHKAASGRLTGPGRAYLALLNQQRAEE